MSDTVICPPLPPLRPKTGWQSVPIEECGEPLILIPQELSPVVRCDPQYVKRGLPAAAFDIFVREGVARRLAKIADDLRSHELTLIVWDGWRPVALQTSLYESYKAQLQTEYPRISEDALNEKVQRFVSLPSQNPLRPSPHLTGGSIDLTLGNREGEPLPMGTPFDSFSEQSATRFYEERSEQQQLSEPEQSFLRNRRRLYHLMHRAGFVNYNEEWWHFDYGNQFWGNVSGRPALYGPISPTVSKLAP